MGLSVCFILGTHGSSGGVRAVTEHAHGLVRDHGMDVSIVLWERDEYAAVPPGVGCLTIDEAREREWDIAIATWWRTAYALFSLPARRRAYFVQQFDERMYEPDDVERFGIAATYSLPVAFVTEAAWIADQLAELRPEASCFLVSNGIDKECFTPPPSSSTERREGDAGEAPLRVLVEGSDKLWFKGVGDAMAVLGATTEPITTTIVSPEEPLEPTRAFFDQVLGPLSPAEMANLYRETDVLLKLSRVDGVFMPPLEAFHCDATCVVWPVTGHDEYIRHQVSGVVTDFDDIPGTAAWLDLLARDRALLTRLREGALEAAAAWPSWEDSTAKMAAALQSISTEPAPESSPMMLLDDLAAGMDEQRRVQLHLRSEAGSLARGLAAAEARRSPREVLRRVGRRVARPLASR